MRTTVAVLVLTGILASVAIAQTVRVPPPVAPPAIRDGARNITDPEVPVFYSRTGVWEGLQLPAEAQFDGGGAASTPNNDRDRDGHAALSLGGDDCDDNDANNYPRSNAEVPDLQGHDEDCNPHTIGSGRYYSDRTLGDRDGDGWLSHLVYNVAHSRDGRPVAIVRGADCDDDNAGTHPDVPEVLSDGIDNNCDGLIDVPPPEPSSYCAPVERSRASSPTACATARRS